jgi:hypothetical protein
MTSRLRKTATFLATLLISGTLGTAIAQDNQEQYDDISAEMAIIRELDLLEPLDVEVKSREELQTETRDDMDTDYPAQDRKDDQQVLVAFGLLDPDQDLGELYVELLGEQIAGYYDPTTNEMVVVASSSEDELSVLDQVTFAHETVHALQDQHFDLESFSDLRLEGTSDESLAITALIEGDATVAQLDFLLGDISLARQFLEEIESDDTSSESLDNAPPILAATLLFPYEYGQVFVQALFDEGGWELVDDAYADPPTSTEQILHPEKYLDGEEAIPVDVPDLSTALGTGWRTIDDDSMGEFQISILLDDGELSEDQVQTASEGWGGDAYTASANGDDVVLAWQTEWDTADDAEEFAKALAIRESNRLDADASGEDNVITIETDDRMIQITQDGESVQYLQAPDQGTLDAVVAELD